MITFDFGMLSVDLNCDMGESFGPWEMGNDAALMPLITSANIACGFHAGDATVMRVTVELAIEHGVAIGAHPGFPDLQGFGRRSITMKPADVYDIVLYQISALAGICRSLGTSLNHVKPHGALYNQAAGNKAMARAVAQAVRAAGPELILYAPHGSHSLSEAEAVGLRIAAEAFVDRSYEPDGSLTPRDRPGALISDPAAAAAQALQLVQSNCVAASDGSVVELKADTLCIHGDGEKAVEYARTVRETFDRNNIEVRPMGRSEDPHR